MYIIFSQFFLPHRTLSWWNQYILVLESLLLIAVTLLCNKKLYKLEFQFFGDVIKSLKFMNCMLERMSSQVALVVNNLPASAGDMRDTGSIPGSGRSPGRRNGNPLQYSCLGSPMVRGAWWATVQRVAKTWTWLRTHWTGQDSTGAEALSWENCRRGTVMKSYKNHWVSRQWLEQELNFSARFQHPT